MPNHVSNKISFKTPDGDWKAEEAALKTIKRLMATDDSPFDFNVLIAYPEHLAALDDKRHEMEKTGLPWDQLPKDGYNQGGYEWCCEHWGTKWNAYDIAFDYDSITFCTAWATPLPIWEALSKHIPDVQMVIEYADEDIGRNCGILIYLNGEVVSETSEKGLRDPDMFARAIVAEQREGDYHQDANELRMLVGLLEARVAELRLKLAANGRHEAA